jgi:hypothetical protein
LFTLIPEKSPGIADGGAIYYGCGFGASAGSFAYIPANKSIGV